MKLKRPSMRLPLVPRSVTCANLLSHMLQSGVQVVAAYSATIAVYTRDGLIE